MAWFATFEARFEMPIIFSTIISYNASSATEPSTFPPDSTAISKIAASRFHFSWQWLRHLL